MAVERALTALETERLVAERIGPQHQDELCLLLGDARVGATLGGVATPAQVAALVAAHAGQWERHGFGLCLWREKATGAPIARGGIQRTHVGGRDEVEVGWAVMAGRWGEGFATELGAASVRFGFEELGLADIVSFTLTTNRSSLRVMEKLGFDFEREIVHAGLPHVLSRRTAALG
jgi:RimJ/RimL family protein N-acetyltransferase